jgi:hypothetical protein
MKDVIETQEFCSGEFEALDINDAIEEPAHKMADKLEAARDSAADALEGAASTLREKSGTFSGVSNNARNRAAFGGGLALAAITIPPRRDALAKWQR